ncbi:hypothetical protein [Pseudomonas putida]|uniref:Uncharacterized protein n=1 Tax=Pseudomonas putida TaxID=303 RepID=A0A8I1EBF6_PSEPU|nr:hypothetical protein [Pseudomonas putida]MBI6882927.1 hypothetical protein [Pseudomonas putida]
MQIDKPETGSDESIVLFPRAYNKRGDDRLHSVQGVTLDGREVNIKLRVDETMLGKESTPSIAEFAREDMKAKNPCMASADNSPGNREGILLFTGCEEDGENKKGILSYTARWAYVLASHSEAPEPVFGLGRVVMIADSHAAKTIHSEITELERSQVEGWEAIAERKRKSLGDPMLFSYYGHLYSHSEELSFDPKNRESIIEFAKDTFTRLTKSGVVGGLLIRVKDTEGNIDRSFSPEIFPRWKKNNTYQSAEDVLGYFFQANAKILSSKKYSTVLAMPIQRYSCGPSFKNYYFLKKPDESLLKLRKRFLINNEPTVCNIALSLSRREDSGEYFMLKYYPIGSPLSSVVNIGVLLGDDTLQDDLEDNIQMGNPELRHDTGLSKSTSLSFPSWYASSLLEICISDEKFGQIQAAESESIGNQVTHEFNCDPAPIVEQDQHGDENQDGDLSGLFADISDEDFDKIEADEKHQQEQFSARQDAIEDQLKSDSRVESEEPDATDAVSVEKSDTTGDQSLTMVDSSIEAEHDDSEQEASEIVPDTQPLTRMQLILKQKGLL